jgi:DNA-binding NtrC family response regulator
MARRISDSLSRLTTRLKDAFHSKASDTPRVLCADDDPGVRQLCSVTLTKAGFVTDDAQDGREVLEKIKTNRYAAILLDLSMPYLHGATVLAVIGREQPDILRRVIVITGAPEAVTKGIGESVAAVLHKPIKLEMLVGAVTDCCSNDDTIVQ